VPVHGGIKKPLDQIAQWLDNDQMQDRGTSA
jgi:hypothetical protein